MDIPPSEILAEEEVRELQTKVEALVDEITGSERLIKTTQTTGTAPGATKPAVKVPTATGGVVSGEVPD
jgi:hypothetical protein